MPLYDASKLQKFKNRLLYEDTRAENMNADKLNTVLRNLIECVKVEEFERPTLDSIASFFAATPTQKKTGVPIKNKERRVVFQIVHGWSHYAVLSPSTDGTVQHLHYADGNNGLSSAFIVIIVRASRPTSPQCVTLLGRFVHKTTLHLILTYYALR